MCLSADAHTKAWYTTPCSYAWQAAERISQRWPSQGISLWLANKVDSGFFSMPTTMEALPRCPPCPVGGANLNCIKQSTHSLLIKTCRLLNSFILLIKRSSSETHQLLWQVLPSFAVFSRPYVLYDRQTFSTFESSAKLEPPSSSALPSADGESWRKSALADLYHWVQKKKKSLHNSVMVMTDTISWDK